LVTPTLTLTTLNLDILSSKQFWANAAPLIAAVALVVYMQKNFREFVS